MKSRKLEILEEMKNIEVNTKVVKEDMESLQNHSLKRVTVELNIRNSVGVCVGSESSFAADKFLLLRFLEKTIEEKNCRYQDLLEELYEMGV